MRSQLDPNTVIVACDGGALITYYDHLDRISLLLLNQQAPRHILTGCCDEDGSFWRSFT